MKKEKLFSYLDGYYFVEESEVTLAINDFFRDYIEKDENYQASYWELIYFQELAEEYIKERNIEFLPF